MFQSTHPRRVWLKFVCKCLIIKVSIHTPTQGVTLSEVCTVSEAIVSIHTPTQGVTTANGKDEFRFTFQSTHPRRVWLCCSLNAVPELAFQSTHPRRVWHDGVRLHSGSSGFNPHTHAGCDRWDSSMQCFFRSFNPHTHAGCDWDCMGSKPIAQMFQSTHPRRVWLLVSIGPLHISVVSIHTPTQGVTLYLITYYKSANLIHCYANHHYYSTS